MFCPKCGNALAEGARFCGHCGAAAPRPVITHVDPPRDPHKPPKPKVLKPLLIVVAVLVLAALTFAGITLLGRKPVYLVSHQVTSNYMIKTITDTEYDGQGRIITHKTTYKYQDGSGDLSTRTEYNYNKSGTLDSVKIKSDGQTWKLEYHYNKKGFLDSIECGRNEAEVTCNKNGQVTEISWDGGSMEYSYHKNGALKEAELDYGPTAYTYIYDEAGHLLEQTSFSQGKKQLVTINAYNKDGKVSSNTQITYSNGKKSSDIITDYFYDKSGLPERLEMTVSAEGEEVIIYLETRDDGLERGFDVVDIDGADVSGADLDELAEILDGEPFMTLKYDKNGNLLESGNALTKSSSVFGQHTTYEYTAVKLPRGTPIPNVNEYPYFTPPIMN